MAGFVRFWPRRNASAGLLYDVARNQGLCPPAIERQLHDFAAYTAVQNRGRLAALAAALDHLAAVGVAVILLKGAALAENLYANLALRPMVDLDLLVRRAAAAPALQHLTTAGYRAIDYGPHMLSTLTFENEIMLIEPGPQAGMLELHWSLFDSPHHQARLPEDWLWQTAQPAPAAGRRALILGNEAQLLHLCGHLALHHAGQSDLLWLHDVAELLQQTAQTLDWELVLAQAQACDLVLSLRQTLARVVAMWQAPAPEGALARLASPAGVPRRKSADRRPRGRAAIDVAAVLGRSGCPARCKRPFSLRLAKHFSHPRLHAPPLSDPASFPVAVGLSLSLGGGAGRPYLPAQIIVADTKQKTCKQGNNV